MALPSAKFGRLKYASKRKAKEAVRMLGLNGHHVHRKDVDGDGNKETVYMPGKNHRNLNRALKQRGMEPTMVPQKGQMNKSGGMATGQISGFDTDLDTSDFKLDTGEILDNKDLSVF